MSKFNEGQAVVWQDEICKVIDVNGNEYTVKNFHSKTTMIVEEAELRKPKPGEFLESNTLSGPENSDGPTILTKSEEVTDEIHEK